MLIVGLILAVSGAIGFIATLMLVRIFLKKNQITEDELVDQEGELYIQLRKYWIIKIAFALDVVIGGVLIMFYR